jgi:AraC family transcriptional regulator of adaptative response/methylated-DNA-[protein]-cysteine methyltransferase
MSSNSERVQAVLERDTLYDGVFVYGVKSTGIYCRPSCGSRKPTPENIELFDTPAEAEASGFRACLRCNPAEYLSPNEVFVERITSYIAAHIDEKHTLQSLADTFDVSKYHLQRTFTSVIGVSPRQYIEAKRLELFKNHIKNGEKVDKAMYGSGFSSRSRLYEKVPEKLGMTPTEYREGGSDVSITYSVFQTSITNVLLARTEKGICALYLGDDEEPLIDELMKEFPYAEIIRDEEGLTEFIKPLNDYFEGRDFNPRLPLDIHRTAFQWQVLKAIQEIPPGETKSYSDLAERIGRPKAVRAVANTCGRNPVSVLIPCHRVLRKNGELGGYHWGIKIKKQLLAHEEKIVK